MTKQTRLFLLLFAFDLIGGGGALYLFGMSIHTLIAWGFIIVVLAGIGNFITWRNNRSNLQKLKEVPGVVHVWIKNGQFHILWQHGRVSYMDVDNPDMFG